MAEVTRPADFSDPSRYGDFARVRDRYPCDRLVYWSMHPTNAKICTNTRSRFRRLIKQACTIFLPLVSLHICSPIPILTPANTINTSNTLDPTTLNTTTTTDPPQHLLSLY